MYTQSMPELAARLTEAVTPWLDPDEQILLRVALGAGSSRQAVAVALELAEQNQCVLPADVAEDVGNWHRRRFAGEDQARHTRTQLSRRPLGAFRNATDRKAG